MTPNQHHYTFLSLGAGVQSSVLLLLACKGILPKPDMAIFSDTQWEPQAVYQHLWWLAEEASKAGIPLIVESRGDIRADALRAMVGESLNFGQRWASMPLYTQDPEGGKGMVPRRCTQEYKIEVIVKAIRIWVGLAKGQRAPADLHVSQWIGISINEKQRMKASQLRWITNEYPLIGWPTNYLGERPWTRAMCVSWFAEHYPGRVLPRSACVACPFKSDEEWVALRKTSPTEFVEACDFDQRIRRINGRMRGETFLHRSCVPLSEVDFTRPDPRQLSFAVECTGFCGN